VTTTWRQFDGPSSFGPVRDQPSAALSTDPAASGVDHAQSLALLAQQTEILELLAAGASLTDVLTAVALSLESHMPDTRCSVLLYDPEQNRMLNAAAPSLPVAYNEAIHGIAVGPRSGSCGTAAYLALPVVARDIRTDPRWEGYRELAATHGLVACWSSPILGRAGEVLGTFAVYHGVPHAPTPREAKLVERYRHLAAIAIAHSRLWGALAESEEQFRRAFEDNAVGMALLDLAGHFFLVNKAMCDLLGWTEDELLGRHYSSVTHPGDVEASAGALAALVAGKASSRQLEKRYLRKDGTLVSVVMTASVVRSRHGVPLHISTNILDLTARNAAQAERSARREAELARAAAETASRAKSDFLSTMSHELRTPLSAIVGFTELLDTLDLAGERRTTALGHIARAAKHILAILDDVLDLAKVEAGAVAIEALPVRLAPLVRGVRELLEPLAADRGLAMHADDLDEDAVALADPRRLRQVLINVVSNAIKYNRPDGSLSISVACSPATADAAARAVITVRDTGLGIPEEVADRLFTPFDRLGAERFAEPGSGLGLVVSDRLVAAMGGALAVRSRPGAGTTVEIAFDARPTSDLPAGEGVTRRPVAPPDPPTGGAARGRVLYVEDDEAHRDLVAEVLRVRPEVRLTMCSHGLQALEVARADPPDLMLLDLDLPDIAGEELIEELRADPRLAAVPVCVLSGRRLAGAADPVCLAKPLDAEALLAELDRALGRAGG
jgi:PAS domain S-box-containing protein